VSAPLLAVSGLCAAVERDRTPILRDVSLTVDRGGALGLVGESGAGKSMIGKAILGILPRAIRVTSGEVRFEGQNLLKMRAGQLRLLISERFALIPQDPITALNPGRRIEGQLTDGLRLIRRLDAAAARRIALRLLAEVHIREPERVLRSFPHELSGGMRQRVLIAAAFALEPTLIIADEPTTALDVTVQKQILELLAQLRRDLRLSLLFITHDLGVVAQIADRVVVMYAGRIVEEGRAGDVIRKPRHPYTQGLLRAAPRLTREKLVPIPGAVPSLDALPKGCAFGPRCAQHIVECDAGVPALRDAAQDQRARCILVP